MKRVDTHGRGVPIAKSSPFLWGVATSAYQCEGGYNRPGQPQTNWAAAELGDGVAALGCASDFWKNYRQDFATCQNMGLSAFRLGIEWSRIQPTFQPEPASPPPFDHQALDAYAQMLGECITRGLEPIVTLHHFVHPAWLGPDPWLDPKTPDYFEVYVRQAVLQINLGLIERGQSPIRYYLTINEPNMLVLNTYLGSQFPTSVSRGQGNALAALNHLLRAHVLAYNCIHDIYEENAWGIPAVSLNTYTSDLYWMDKIVFDLLAARERMVAPEHIPCHLREKAIEFNNALAQSKLPRKSYSAAQFGSVVRTISYQLSRWCLSPRTFQPFLETLFQGSRNSVMDYVAIDYYDPFCAHVFRLPMFSDHEGPCPSMVSSIVNSVTSKWWDWRVLPEGLRFFCAYYSKDLRSRPVLIAENGMALRRDIGNRTSPRRDKLSRSEFIAMHIREVTGIASEGIPLFGYLHWSLFDNYEWGSFTPRFGLFSLDYQKSGTRRLFTDHQGDSPSLTYAKMIRIANSRFKRISRRELELGESD